MGAGQFLIPLIVIGLMVADVSLGDTDTTQAVLKKEHELLKALEGKDKLALLSLTDGNFHVSLDVGSAWRHTITDISRNDWITMVTSKTVGDYRAKILRIQPSRDNQVIVTIEESWQTGDDQTHRRFQTEDIWTRHSDKPWTLMDRLSHSY